MKNIIDIALTVVCNNKTRPDLTYLKIGETRLVFAVAKNHPLARKKVVSVEDLKDIPLITLKEDSLQYEIVTSLFREAGIKPNIRLLSNQLSTIKETVSYGSSGAFLFHQVIKEGDDIVAIPLKENIHFDITMVYKKEKLTPTGEKFLRFVLDNTESFR